MLPASDDRRSVSRRIVDALAVPERVVLALDYDGTLVAIRPRPEQATPMPRLLALLRDLARRRDMKLAFVSGRSLAEIRDLLPVPGAAHLGNHGLEIQDGRTRWIHPAAERRRPALRFAARTLEPIVAAVPGAWVEDKGITLSVHHRNVRRRGAAERLARAVRATVHEAGEDLRLTHGKRVWEIRPSVDWDKGRALERWLRTTRRRGVVLVMGDDRTDEDAFRRLRKRAVTVKVGPGPTAAAWRLPRPRVVPMLEALLRARGGRPSRSRRGSAGA